MAKKANRDHSKALAEVRDLAIGLQGAGYRLAQEQKLYGDAGLPDSFLLLPVSAPRLIARLKKAIAVLERLEEKGYTGLFPVWYEAKMEGDELRKDPRSKAQREFAAMSGIAGVPVVTGKPADFIDWLRENGFKL